MGGGGGGGGCGKESGSGNLGSILFCLERHLTSLSHIECLTFGTRRAKHTEK